MIVRPGYFEDDEDVDAQREQHAVYDGALSIIVSSCNRHTNFARSLLEDSRRKTWGAVNCYDHRTLQDAHDLLAAAWRFQDGGSYRQGKLSFAGEAPFDDVQVLWLNWLRHEVDGWTSSPHLVRSVQIILSNQNKPLGYMAESKLCLDIFDRFSNIPWDEKLYEAHEKDLYEEIAVS